MTMATINDINIHFPGKLVFGSGKIMQLKDELLRLNSRKLLLITIEPLLGKLESLISGLKEDHI
jgi:hypothetical protein